MDTYQHWTLYQRAARLADTTITERIRIVKAFATETRIDPLTAQPLDIAGWIASHPEWSQATTCTYWAALSAFYRWAVLHEHITISPLVKLAPPRQPDRMPRPVTDTEVARLLAAPKRRRAHRMILLATCAGLRVHEIARVHSDHIDVDGANLTVDGKGGRVARLPLHDLLRAEWEHMQPGWWFPSPYEDRPIRARSAAQVITRAMQQAGVNGTPHQLRHWHATRLLEDGADLRLVQDLMRHRSIQTTVQYTRLPDRSRRAAIQRLDPTTPAIH